MAVSAAHRTENPHHSSDPGAAKVETIPTGIDAFDQEVGGLPAGTFTLVAGGEGTGKTTLALQFLCQGLENGERVFLITSDTPEKWLLGAEAFQWPLTEAVEAGYLHILYQKSQVPHIITTDAHLDELIDMLEQEILPWEPKRLVIDSAVPFLELLHPAFRKYALNKAMLKLSQMGLTTVLTTRMPASSETMALRKHMEDVSGCSIHLDEQRTPDGESKRRLVCRKHVAIAPPYPVYHFTIEPGRGILTDGASPVPLQSPAEEVKMPRKPAKSGLFAAAMSKTKATQTDSATGGENSASARNPSTEADARKPKSDPVRFSFRAPSKTSSSSEDHGLNQ